MCKAKQYIGGLFHKLFKSYHDCIGPSAPFARYRQKRVRTQACRVIHKDRAVRMLVRDQLFVAVLSIEPAGCLWLLPGELQD